MCWARILSGTADPTKRRVIRDIIVKLIYLVLLLPKNNSNKFVVCFFFHLQIKILVSIELQRHNSVHLSVTIHTIGGV